MGDSVGTQPLFWFRPESSRPKLNSRHVVWAKKVVNKQPGTEIATVPAHPVKIRDFGLVGQEPGTSGAVPGTRAVAPGTRGATPGVSGARPGTGLGLSIVKHIVNRHRGGLIVESQKGYGTTFSVYFPVTERRGVTEPG